MLTNIDNFWVWDILGDKDGERYIVNRIECLAIDPSIISLHLSLASLGGLSPDFDGECLSSRESCKNLYVIKRGNFWRYAQGLPLKRFKNSEIEAYFWYALDKAVEISELEEPVNDVSTLLRKIKEGKLDGYFTTGHGIYGYRSTNWHGVQLKDKIRGRQLARRTLIYYEYKLFCERARGVLNLFPFVLFILLLISLILLLIPLIVLFFWWMEKG